MRNDSNLILNKCMDILGDDKFIKKTRDYVDKCIIILESDSIVELLKFIKQNIVNCLTPCQPFTLPLNEKHNFNTIFSFLGANYFQAAQNTPIPLIRYWISASHLHF